MGLAGRRVVSCRRHVVSARLLAPQGGEAAAPCWVEFSASCLRVVVCAGRHHRHDRPGSSVRLLPACQGSVAPSLLCVRHNSPRSSGMVAHPTGQLHQGVQSVERQDCENRAAHVPLASGWNWAVLITARAPGLHHVGELAEARRHGHGHHWLPQQQGGTCRGCSWIEAPDVHGASCVVPTSSGTSSWRRRTRNASSGWSAQRSRKNLISKVSRSMVCALQICARLCVTTWRCAQPSAAPVIGTKSCGRRRR